MSKRKHRRRVMAATMRRSRRYLSHWVSFEARVFTCEREG